MINHPECSQAVMIRVSAKKYEDIDDCLAAAAADVAADRNLDGWDLHPRWEDEQRDAILLIIPSYAARDGE